MGRLGPTSAEVFKIVWLSEHATRGLFTKLQRKSGPENKQKRGVDSEYKSLSNSLSKKDAAKLS